MTKERYQEDVLAALGYRRLDDTHWAKPIGYDLMVYDSSSNMLSHHFRAGDQLACWSSQPIPPRPDDYTDEDSGATFQSTDAAWFCACIMDRETEPIYARGNGHGFAFHVGPGASNLQELERI